MSNTSGRRVTPLASPDSYPTDPLPLNTDPQVVAEYHKAHDNETDEEKRAVQVRALTEKKQKVGGMGIYKTGTRLVGQRQRRLFARGSAEGNDGVEEVESGLGGEGWMEENGSEVKSKGKNKVEESEEEGSEEDVEMG